MCPRPLNPGLSLLLLTLAPVAAWAVWLGWDQHQDVHPDGSVSGPYEAWQVIGLVLTLVAPVYWAASRQRVVSAVFGTTVGLTVASYYDWSDNETGGLFVVGVGMVMVGSLLCTLAVSSLIACLTPQKS
ncbi:hypothetical protein [Streptomyces purpureus]|uniref:Uncharacterized protein n=1 Tax=Streptomyces purpureus TaxID=1951 RepID=A0A918H3Z4_9ACTN|nr:hypothetical protein [Streptomyces purpureus]GGT37093.1 hypothetical protein GCM10014713_33560 [Streptomyces purpureus]